jgi:hypothetical protein
VIERSPIRRQIPDSIEQQESECARHGQSIPRGGGARYPQCDRKLRHSSGADPSRSVGYLIPNGEMLEFLVAKVTWILPAVHGLMVRSPSPERRAATSCALRSDRPKRRTVALRASVGSTEVTVCLRSSTLTTPCARVPRRHAEPSDEQRARVEPRSRSRRRKQFRGRSFVLAAWSTCGGPWWSTASELAVAPSSTPRLTELEHLVGPSAPCMRHTTDCLQRCPAHLTECRARLTYALALPLMARSTRVALLSRSKLADFATGPTRRLVLLRPGCLDQRIDACPQFFAADFFVPAVRRGDGRSRRCAHAQPVHVGRRANDAERR